jgi:hypothetical protein
MSVTKVLARLLFLYVLRFASFIDAERAASRGRFTGGGFPMGAWVRVLIPGGETEGGPTNTNVYTTLKLYKVAQK